AHTPQCSLEIQRAAREQDFAYIAESGCADSQPIAIGDVDGALVGEAAAALNVEGAAAETGIDGSGIDEVTGTIAEGGGLQLDIRSDLIEGQVRPQRHGRRAGDVIVVQVSVAAVVSDVNGCIAARLRALEKQTTIRARHIDGR